MLPLRAGAATTGSARADGSNRPRRPPAGRRGRRPGPVRPVPVAGRGGDEHDERRRGPGPTAPAGGVVLRPARATTARLPSGVRWAASGWEYSAFAEQNSGPTDAGFVPRKVVTICNVDGLSDEAVRRAAGSRANRRWIWVKSASSRGALQQRRRHRVRCQARDACTLQPRSLNRARARGDERVFAPLRSARSPTME